MIVNDFLDRELEFNNIPGRIVSLVPSQTELLVDLGLEEQIAGITKFCVHPKRLKSTKAIVGGTKQVHVDKIKSLRPDIILCNKEENTADMVEQLSKIAPVHVSDIKTLGHNYRLIQDYALIFNKSAIGKKLIAQLESACKKFKKSINNKPKLKVAYLIWREPWMTVGHDTFINHMLEVNNFINVYANENRYPKIDLSDVPDIDLLLLSSEPYPFKQKHLDEIPFPNEKIKFVNGEYFSWYGSRMIKAFEYFKQFRHLINNFV